MKSLLQRLKIKNDYIRSITCSFPMRNDSEAYDTLECNKKYTNIHGWSLSIIENPNRINQIRNVRVFFNMLKNDIITLDLDNPEKYTTEKCRLLFGKSIFGLIEEDFQRKMAEIDQERDKSLHKLYAKREEEFKKYLDGRFKNNKEKSILSKEGIDFWENFNKKSQTKQKRKWEAIMKIWGDKMNALIEEAFKRRKRSIGSV